MLLDLVNRISSEREVKKNFRHLSLSTLKVLQGTSRINLPGKSLERQIKTSPGRHFRTSVGRSNRIFKGCPEDVGGKRPPDVLGTNICRLGSNKKYHLKTFVNATDVATCIIATESVSCIVLTETSTYRIDYKTLTGRNGASLRFDQSYNKEIKQMSNH